MILRYNKELVVVWLLTSFLLSAIWTSWLTKNHFITYSFLSWYKLYFILGKWCCSFNSLCVVSVQDLKHFQDLQELGFDCTPSFESFLTKAQNRKHLVNIVKLLLRRTDKMRLYNVHTNVIKVRIKTKTHKASVGFCTFLSDRTKKWFRKLIKTCIVGTVFDLVWLTW